MQKPKTIKLDKETVVNRSDIQAIYKYNKWRVEVYVDGNCFTIKFSQDNSKAGLATDLFVNILELLCDPIKGNDGSYGELSNKWYNYDDTLKQFVLDSIEGANQFAKLLS